jgi:hypothetical protein
MRPRLCNIAHSSQFSQMDIAANRDQQTAPIDEKSSFVPDDIRTLRTGHLAGIFHHLEARRLLYEDRSFGPSDRRGRDEGAPRA